MLALGASTHVFRRTMKVVGVAPSATMTVRTHPC
jgi:hypothetical protein